MYDMYKICSEIYLETSNICENILHMYGMIRIILCWVHQTMCRYKPQSRRIDQAIKHPATLNLAEFTAGQDRDHTTARARAVPASILGNLYKTLSMHDLGPDSWQWVRWLPGRCHGQHSPRRASIQNLKYTPGRKNRVPGLLWAGRHGISVITLDPCRSSPSNLVRIQART